MGRTSNARERLIAAASALLYEGGYQGVGVDELCSAAGVRKGSFYYFFPSKQDLALAALDQFFEKGWSELMGPSLDSDLPPLERIRTFFELMYTSSAAAQKANGFCGGCMFGSLVAEMGNKDPLIRRKVQTAFETLARRFELTLREAVSAGEVSDIDPKVNARSLVAYMEGILLLAKANNDAGVLRQLGPAGMALATAPKKRTPARSRSPRKQRRARPSRRHL